MYEMQNYWNRNFETDIERDFKVLRTMQIFREQVTTKINLPNM